jgi:sulfite exporter TauE/SafE
MADAALAASAWLMGLAATPHCLAMCGPACGALAARGSAGALGAPMLALHAGRLASYAAAGAAVAGSSAWLARWTAQAAWLHPLWLLLHLAALGLGAWLLWQARLPAWLGAVGRRSVQPVARPVAGRRGPIALAPSTARCARAGTAGLLWAAWPCGLLQAALLAAALASDSLAGAGVMAAFAAGSGFGLAAGPIVFARWMRGGAHESAWQRLAVRLAGAVLLAASAWALWHGSALEAAFCLAATR